MVRWFIFVPIPSTERPCTMVSIPTLSYGDRRHQSLR
jgi:hypothetical protein